MARVQRRVLTGMTNRAAETRVSEPDEVPRTSINGSPRPRGFLSRTASMPDEFNASFNASRESLFNASKESLSPSKADLPMAVTSHAPKALVRSPSRRSHVAFGAGGPTTGESTSPSPPPAAGLPALSGHSEYVMQVMRDFFQSRSPEALLAVFREADADKSGMIEYNEVACTLPAPISHLYCVSPTSPPLFEPKHHVEPARWVPMSQDPPTRPHAHSSGGACASSTST